MNNFRIILSIIILSSFSCEKDIEQTNDCNDILIEDQLLSDYTNSFNNYENIEKAIFKNDNGEEVVFNLFSVKDTIIEFRESTLCDKERIEVMFYRQEKEIVLKSDDKYTLTLILEVDYGNNEREYNEERICEFIYYKFLSAGVDKSTLSLFRIMVYNKSGIIDVDAYNLDKKIELREEYMVNDKKFHNVYDKNSLIKINRERGLVSFVENEKTYVFDRFE